MCLPDDDHVAPACSIALVHLPGGALSEAILVSLLQILKGIRVIDTIKIENFSLDSRHAKASFIDPRP